MTFKNTPEIVEECGVLAAYPEHNEQVCKLLDFLLALRGCTRWS